MSALDAAVEIVAELAMIANIGVAVGLGLRDRVGLAWVFLAEAVAWAVVVMLVWSALP